MSTSSTKCKLFEEPNLAAPRTDFARRSEMAATVERAFDYRGDVTIRLTSGRLLEGYVFNRDAKCPIPFLELFPKSGGPPVTVRFDELTDIQFTGPDTAAGKSWEAWQRRVQEAEAKGTFAELYPESLDEA